MDKKGSLSGDDHLFNSPFVCFTPKSRRRTLDKTSLGYKSWKKTPQTRKLRGHKAQDYKISSRRQGDEEEGTRSNYPGKRHGTVKTSRKESSKPPERSSCKSQKTSQKSCTTTATPTSKSTTWCSQRHFRKVSKQNPGTDQDKTNKTQAQIR